MGQKTHPYGFRLGVIKTWTSKWYEDKHYTTWLHEDIRIKRAVKEYLYNANVASVEVERAANKAKVIVYTARPGMVIGKGGKGIEILKNPDSVIQGAGIYLLQDSVTQMDDLWAEAWANPDMTVEEIQQRFVDIIASAE